MIDRIPLNTEEMFAPSFGISIDRRNEKQHLNPNTMNTLKNKVHLIGNLGFDPEVREIAKGRKVARISVATNDSYRNASGERVTDTQWHTVVAWGSTAEAVERMLRKGSPVALEGRLVHRSYETKDGTKRYITEVVMNDFQLLPSKAEAAA